MDRKTLESALQDQAKAPRISLKDVQDNISSVHYFTARQGVDGEYGIAGVDDECVRDAEHLKLLTFCVIVSKNGFTFIGSSACASPENFNPEIGKKIAYDNAFNQMWLPMGYELKTRLASEPKDWKERLLKESKELSAKIEKLKQYLDQDKVQGLDKALLIQQKSVMLEYLEILADRLLRAADI